ncbi:ExbD/TolR family protein [Mariniblastus fucicola]|uniref:Biopolymer transport protein ExbD n=1 Tax=Mariniblastus fucicola TaxID=980251 RepID=A0A5B9PB66_9BACT|nr:biopolymer transporter ExbD [Mariniblastus fucicola]QEG20361.1 biopolymer transport protein ExbD [Mariniblastus fucicola]
MKLSRTRPHHTLAFNMTPMIDIVFLLIIFFMTVSQITRTVDHPVELPRVVEGASESKTATVTINLNEKGSVIVAGKVLSQQEVVTAIQAQLEKMDNDPDRIRIQIRCDRNCLSKFVNQLVNRLSTMGFRKVRCAVADQ